MSIIVDFSPIDIQYVEKQALSRAVSIEEFSRKAIMKAARNAEYVAKIDRGFKQMTAGTCQSHELIEV